MQTKLRLNSRISLQRKSVKSLKKEALLFSVVKVALKFSLKILVPMVTKFLDVFVFTTIFFFIFSPDFWFKKILFQAQAKGHPRLARLQA